MVQIVHCHVASIFKLKNSTKHYGNGLWLMSSLTLLDPKIITFEEVQILQKKKLLNKLNKALFNKLNSQFWLKNHVCHISVYICGWICRRFYFNTSLSFICSCKTIENHSVCMCVCVIFLICLSLIQIHTFMCKRKRRPKQFFLLWV